MLKKTIWFMKGFDSLVHAMIDIQDADKKKEFEILCTHDRPNFKGFKFADYYEMEPQLKGEAFINYCKKMVAKYSVKVIIASNKQDLLSLHKSEFEELGVGLAIATNHETFDTVNNKGKLYKKFLNKPFVKIPEHTLVNSSDEFLYHYHQMKKSTSDLCVKPAVGVYGSGFYSLAETTHDFENLQNSGRGRIMQLADYANKLKKFSQPVLLMRYLEGHERSVDCLAYNGKLIGAVSRVKLSNPNRQMIEKNSSIINQVKHITQELKLNGIFNVQFRDSRNEHFLLEINPRLSGRAYYATLAGLNLPYWASLLFSGLILPQDISFTIDYDLVLWGRRKVLSNSC